MKIDYENNELKYISQKFTDVVASQLHYFEEQDKVDLLNCSAADVVRLTEGYIDRYRSDPIFNAKVESMVANLMQSIMSFDERQRRQGNV